MQRAATVGDDLVEPHGHRYSLDVPFHLMQFMTKGLVLAGERA